MGLSVLAIYEMPEIVPIQIFSQLETIILKMRGEELTLSEWELTEMPAESVFCFRNYKTLEAFDYEPDITGEMTPHYYKHVKGEKVTKFPTRTIVESINSYTM